MYLFPDKLSKINFEYPLERHKPKNGPDINLEPIYNMNFPKEKIRFDYKMKNNLL